MSYKKRIHDSDDESTEQKVKSKIIEKKSKITTDAREPKLFDLGKLKKVSVSEFKGQLLLNFREYYVDKATGEEKPGSKGIALNRSQWEEFKKVVFHFHPQIPDLDAAFEADDEK